jgi:hypothetical protein
LNNCRRRRNTSPSSTTNSRTSHSSSINSFGARFFRRRRTFNSHGNNLFAAEEEKAECAAVFTVTVGGFLTFYRWKFAKLFAVAENEIHVAVEGHELSDELTTVLNCYAHTVVDVLKHFGTL